MAKKEKPVYRWFCEYHHDSTACQEALRILEAIETKKDKEKKNAMDDETPTTTTSDPGECGEKKKV